MKLLTLNMHSLAEVRGLDRSWEERLFIIADKIVQERYDVIALQEVNQPAQEQAIGEETLRQAGYIAAEEAETIRWGNAAYALAEILQKRKQTYQWSYTVAHRGYEIYEEGTAVFSRYAAEQAISFAVSSRQEKGSWTYRRQIALETLIQGQRFWFVSVHFGWWEGRDGSEGFAAQWERMKLEIANQKPEAVFLLGDWNQEDTVRSEGYDLVREKDAYFDSYVLAVRKPIFSQRFTTPGAAIDGWEMAGEGAKRLDYVMLNRQWKVGLHQNVFDGKNGARVSDHFGVEVEIETQEAEA